MPIHHYSPPDAVVATGNIEGTSLAAACAWRNRLLIAPFKAEVIDVFRPLLVDDKVNKKTVQVPVDWKVDKKLLTDLVAASAKPSAGSR